MTKQIVTGIIDQ